MAQFNPNVGVNDAPNYTGRSQGLPANRIGEVLIGGLTNAAEGLAKTKDIQITENIKQDVRDVFDVTNNAYGLDEQAGYGSAPNSTAIPPELKGTAEHFAMMVQARKAGKLSESHYWSLLTTSMKEVKAKYPGYADIIDNVYADVTGAKPALALRNSLESDYQSELNAAKSSASEKDKMLKQYATEINSVAPDFWANREKYAGREDQVLNEAINLKANREANLAESQKLNLLKQQDQLNKDQAKEVYNRRVQGIVTDTINGGLNAAGFDSKNFMDVVTNLAQKGPTPEEVQGLQNQLLVAEGNIRQKFLELRGEPWTTAMSQAEINDAENNALATVNAYRDMITNDKTGLAVWHANANKIMAERSMNSLKEKFPDLQTIQTLNRVSPDLAAAVVLRSGGKSEQLVDTISNNLLIGTLAGGTSANDVVGSLEAEKNLTTAQKSAIVTNFIQGMEQSITSNEASKETVIEFAKKNFMGDYPEMIKFMNRINEEDRLPVFLKMTSPAISEKFAASDRIASVAYASWAKNQFETIPEVADTLANMTDSNENPVYSKYFEYVYNDSTNTISVVPKDTGGKPGEYSLLNQNSMLRIEQQKIQKLNTAMSNTVYALEKAGVDGDQAILEILARKGIKVGEDGSTSTGPLGGIEGTINDAVKLASYGNEDFNIDLANTTSDMSSTQPLLSFIGGLEAPGGYNQMFGGGMIDEGLTLNDVIRNQTERVASGSPSSATGRYQFLRSTLQTLKRNLGLTGDEQFTPELQDRLANALLEVRGLSKFRSGKITAERFADNLAKEWASLPYNTGNSYYAGDGLNRSLTTREKLLEQLSLL